MIRSPKLNHRVRVHYATKAKRKGLAIPSAFMPWHGKEGVIVTVPKGRGGPCNVGVRLDAGEVVVVPRGNLVAVKGA